MTNALDFLSEAQEQISASEEIEQIKLLPHNQMLYDQIVEKIESGERSIFYSEATGLGKSFIFMKLVQDLFRGKKVLYIVPKLSIWDNLTRYKEFQYLDAQIEMCTYASFNNYEKDLWEKYDVVFADECHHMLSDIQGTNVRKYFKDMTTNNKYVFGLTATPYYSGQYVDEVCFDVSCYGLDVFEAIHCGLLPKIKLALANIDIDSIPADLRVKYSISGTETLLNRILKEHSDITRWLAYFSSKSELEASVCEIQTLFPEFEILKLYEGVEDEASVIRRFQSTDKKVVLMSVNKLLEGVHLSKVGGVLLYRNVVELSTYMQIYGRLCNINTEVTPVFLDVTNAIVSINKVSESKSTRYTGNRQVFNKRDLFDVDAVDYWTIELAEFLGRDKRAYYLTDEQKDLVDKLILENPGVGYRKIKEVLGFDVSGVYILERKKELGITRYYDQGFLNKFKEAYERDGYRGVQCLDECKNWTPNKIKNLAKYYKYKSPNAISVYTEEELILIDKYLYTDKVIRPTSDKLLLVFNDRSLASIQAMVARRMTKVSLRYEAGDYICESCGNAASDCTCKMHVVGFTAQELRNYGVSFEFDYKGIACNGLKNLSKVIGVPYANLSGYKSRTKCTNTELIDWVFETNPGIASKFGYDTVKWYRGINISRPHTEISQEFGLAKRTFTYIKTTRHIETIEGVIDYIFEKYPEIRKRYESCDIVTEYRGIPIKSAVVASRHLGKGDNYVGKIMRVKGLSIQGAIDYALDRVDTTKYTDEQITWLKDNADKYTIREISAMESFKNRTWASLYQKVKSLGLHTKPDKLR